MTRLRGARIFGAGLVDQVVIATANAGNTLLAAALLDRHRAGTLLISLAVGYVVLSLNRAFVGEVLLALTARFRSSGDDIRRRLVGDGLAAALTVGALSAVVLAVAWRAVSGVPDLIWVALVVPFVLLHDTARYSYLADGTPQRALVIDLTFTGTQALAVLAVVAVGVSPARLVLCWGAGALAGFGLFAVRTGHRPWRGRVRRWFGQTGFLSGWFTATAVVAQAQVLAVTAIVSAVLSESALAGFRLIQAVVLQPVQNFNQSLMSLLVPRVSELAGSAENDPAAAQALRRQVLRGAAVLGVLALLMIAVGGAVSQAVIPHVKKYADTAPLAWPMLVQGGIYMVQAPFTSAIRGMHRARLQFLQYVVFSVASLVGLVAGAAGHGLVGAGWGLAAGSLTGLLVTIATYLYAQRRFGRRDSRVAAISET